MGEYRDKKSEQSFSQFACTLNRVFFYFPQAFNTLVWLRI